MKRRGQLTIFLAAGVVVLFAFVFLFILSSQINNNSILTVNEDVPPPLLSYVKNTLEDAARSAVIETIAPQSGYQDPTSAENQQPTLFYGKELEMNSYSPREIKNSRLFPQALKTPLPFSSCSVWC